MKFLFVALLVASAIATPFQQYLQKFGKHYSGAEYFRREKIYEANMIRAQQLHEESPSANFGETKFADLTQEEWAAQYLLPDLYRDAPNRIGAREPDAVTCLPWGVYKRGDLPTAPDPFDWNKNPTVVWPVRDQGSCGSCWAFSTVEAIEGVYGVKGTPTTSPLSPQFIVDCSKSCSWEQYSGMNYTVCNGGCNGGWPWTAFWDVGHEIGGVPLDSTYPYTGVTGTCRIASGTLYKISTYTCISTWQGAADEAKMTDISYAQGPLSIAINANPFQLYTNGIINLASCATNPLNHAVLITGWGSDSTGLAFWNIKNSWGAAWGESGYVRVARGKGMCGVNEGVSIPVI